MQSVGTWMFCLPSMKHAIKCRERHFFLTEEPACESQHPSNRLKTTKTQSRRVMQPGMQLTNTMFNEYAYDSEFPLQHPPEDDSSSGWDGLQETQDT